MKNIVVRYGVIASLIVVGVPLLSGLIIGFGMDSFAMGEIVGYTSMIVAMTTVYFAMHHYRDQINKGVLSFGLGLKIGSLISVLAGIAFAIYNVVFVTFIMPDFNKQYFAYAYAYAEGLELGTPEFEAKFAAMMEANSFMFSVLGGTILMFSTVFLIGFIVSLISALILQRKQVMAV